MSRQQPTFADYMVIAISPALIMAMVGSLVFFLIEAFYHGEYSARLCYISALFVFAAVLIARIAMDEGRAYASVFAFFLGIAVWLAMKRFTNIPTPFDEGLLALIWWCADKLMWDCTLVDESKDPSSQGLLETVGFGDHDAEEESSAGDESTGTKVAPASKADGDGIVIAAMNDPETTIREVGEQAKNWWAGFKRRPNRPGVWVVFFSLAALPLFGVGQWFIPAADAPARRYAFTLLCVYLASGFGLLVTTSFLGLRHYLRKRQLEMPSYMAGVWLGTGVLKIAVLLILVSMLTFLIWMIPRQRVESEIAKIPSYFTSPDNLKPSKYGLGNDGPSDKEKANRTGQRGEDGDREKTNGTRSSEKQGDGKAADGKSKDGQKDSYSGKSGDGNKQDGKSKQQNGKEAKGKQSSSGGNRGGQSSSKNKDKQGSSESKSGQSQSSGTSQMFSKLASSAGMLMRSLFYLVLLLVLVAFLWFFRKELREVWERLLHCWQLFFGRRTDATEDIVVADEPAGPPPRPFSDFANPFAGGAANRYSPDELVKYSFEAFEAWAREHDCSRRPEETPHELAQHAGSRQPSLTSSATGLADLYCQVAYAPGSLTAASLEHLKRFWQQVQMAEATH